MLGHYPLYVDGHQHVHVLPLVREVFAATLNKFGIRRTRLPAEINLDQCSWLEKETLQFYKMVCLDSVAATECFKLADIGYSDIFVQDLIFYDVYLSLNKPSFFQ